MITDVYMVPFADLKRAAGSKDPRLLEAIREECGTILRNADGYLDRGATVTCADALADLIEGADFREYPPRHLYRYRCALEAIWAYLGEYVGQLEVDATEELDEALAELDIPSRYSDLVSGAEVVPLPPWNDVPRIGSWSPEQVAAAMRGFRRSDVEPSPWEEGGSYEEPEEMIGLLRHFAEEASARPGWGLVAISH